MLAAGLVIVYSFLLLLSTCAFWFVKLDNILQAPSWRCFARMVVLAARHAYMKRRLGT